MARPRQPSESKRKRPPAKTPEARENQVIAMAYDLAEEQIRSGTASSQVITHFLKLGTEKERIEQEKLKNEVALLKAKTEGLQSMARQEELYEQALKAMRSYSGQKDDDYED